MDVIVHRSIGAEGCRFAGQQTGRYNHKEAERNTIRGCCHVAEHSTLDRCHGRIWFHVGRTQTAPGAAGQSLRRQLASRQRSKTADKAISSRSSAEVLNMEHRASIRVTSRCHIEHNTKSKLLNFNDYRPIRIFCTHNFRRSAQNLITFVSKTS